MANIKINRDKLMNITKGDVSSALILEYLMDTVNALSAKYINLSTSGNNTQFIVSSFDIGTLKSGRAVINNIKPDSQAFVVSATLDAPDGQKNISGCILANRINAELIMKINTELNNSAEYHTDDNNIVHILLAIYTPEEVK